MQRDFKIGLFLGLVFVIAVVLWLCKRPSLSPEARMNESQDTTIHRETSAAPIKTRDVAESVNNQLSIINNQSRSVDYTVYEQPEKIKTQRFHIVQRGETLSAIASKYYGSGSKWQKLFEANRRIIKDANKIQPGIKLLIPD